MSATKIVTSKQVCEELGVCRQTLRRWIEAGRFPRPLRLHRNYVWLRATYETAVNEAATEAK